VHIADRSHSGRNPTKYPPQVERPSLFSTDFGFGSTDSPNLSVQAGDVFRRVVSERRVTAWGHIQLGLGTSKTIIMTKIWFPKSLCNISHAISVWKRSVCDLWMSQGWSVRATPFSRRYLEILQKLIAGHNRDIEKNESVNRSICSAIFLCLILRSLPLPRPTWYGRTLRVGFKYGRAGKTGIYS
jgi:hypothetical protein